jgi:hypothetical protein
LKPDIFKLKKEGDDCEIDNGDSRGTYEIDSKGKCVLKSCDSGWKVDGKKCTKILESIGGDKVPQAPAPAPAPARPLTTPGAAKLYEEKILQQPTVGYPAAARKPYMSGFECETTCNDDDDCYAAMYTDTVNSSVNDNACWHFGKPTGDVTWGSHQHYSTLVKGEFDEPVYENPKFIEGNALITGTPWTGTTGWDTFHSGSAHGDIYLSWHPFTYSSSKQWASFTGQDKPHVGIKYPKPVILKGFIIESTSDTNNYTPDSLVVEGSNDGNTWTMIKDVMTPSSAIGYNNNKKSIIAREMLKNNNIKFSQYRVRVTSSNKATVYNNITEIRLFTTKG